MEKIFNFILVERSEAKNKWWHRLFTVFLIGSGIIVLILSFIFAINNDDDFSTSWIINRPLVFSLESNYQQINGKELPCNSTIDFSSGSTYLSSIIECKGVDIPLSTAKRYQELYDIADKNLEKQFGLDKYNGVCSNLTHNPSGGLSQEEISCLKKHVNDRESDPAYSKYQNALKDIAKIKVETIYNFNGIFNLIILWLIIPAIVLTLWVVFWSHIVYRSILYIIFGKKDK